MSLQVKYRRTDCLQLTMSGTAIAYLALTAPETPVQWLIVLITTLGFIYLYLMRKYDYWKRRGVIYAKPTFFYGNTKEITFQRSPAALVYQKIYNDLNGQKFGGFFSFFKPTLMIRDPSLIKSILGKEFGHFSDRSGFLKEEKDSLSSHLLNMTGQRWENTRKQIVPAFHSRKVRLMEHMIKDHVKILINHLLEDIKNDSTETDVGELMARLATDIIGQCAFGLNCNAVKNEHCEYRKIEELVCESSIRTIIRDIFRNLCPMLNHLCKLKGHHPDVDKFFMARFREMTEERKEYPEKKDDFFQCLIDLQASDPTFSENAAAANAFFIFFAGFSTIASTLTYALYELSINQEMWQMLREEVKSVQDHNGDLDFDSLKTLSYMEAVLSETLRKYSVFPSLQRQCREDFRIPDTSVTIEKGVNIIIPIHALHRDPKYWPNPDEFLPERFLKKDCHSHPLVDGAYLPFGSGKRGCLGTHFAKAEMKLILAYFVTNFEVKPSDRTIQPLELVPRGVILAPKGGIWLRLQRALDP